MAEQAASPECFQASTIHTALTEQFKSANLAGVEYEQLSNRFSVSPPVLTLDDIILRDVTRMYHAKYFDLTLRDRVSGNASLDQERQLRLHMLGLGQAFFEIRFVNDDSAPTSCVIGKPYYHGPESLFKTFSSKPGHQPKDVIIRQRSQTGIVSRDPRIYTELTSVTKDEKPLYRSASLIVLGSLPNSELEYTKYEQGNMV